MTTPPSPSAATAAAAAATPAHTAHLTPQYVIGKKRRNDEPHSAVEISWFIRQFTEGYVTDYQMTAWLMAVCLNGMTDDETAALTEAMVRSGATMDWSTDLPPGGGAAATAAAPVPHRVDKHSTGGVGDKVSLVLAPLVASFGLIVPMMAGRGLGHTGGTIDKLESIPGFRARYATDEFRTLLLSPPPGSDEPGDDAAPLGAAIASPSDDVCPADKRMYALRDVTATVTSLPLQTSSIMSKKIAERPDSLVLDVKFGRGSFNNIVEESLKLAKSMIQTGERCGIRTTALVTRMDDPLGSSVGNWLEVEECIEVMTAGTDGNGGEADGDLSKDLVDVTLALAGQMLVQGGKADTLEQGVSKARDHLRNGKAWKKFRQMVRAQGGDVSLLDSPEKYPRAKHSAQVLSPCAGYVSSVDAMEIGLVGVSLGAGRRTAEESVDFTAGVRLRKKAGMHVRRGDVLAEAFTERDGALEDAVRRVREAFRFSDAAVDVPPLIANVVTKDGVEPFDQSTLAQA